MPERENTTTQIVGTTLKQIWIRRLLFILAALVLLDSILTIGIIDLDRGIGKFRTRALSTEPDKIPENQPGFFSSPEDTMIIERNPIMRATIKISPLFFLTLKALLFILLVYLGRLKNPREYFFWPVIGAVALYLFLVITCLVTAIITLQDYLYIAEVFKQIQG